MSEKALARHKRVLLREYFAVVGLELGQGVARSAYGRAVLDDLDVVDPKDKFGVRMTIRSSIGNSLAAKGVSYGIFELNPIEGLVKRTDIGLVAQVTPFESGLLMKAIINGGKVVPQADFFQGHPRDINSDILKVWVNRIRAKIQDEKILGGFRFWQNVRGIGYRLTSPSTAV